MASIAIAAVCLGLAGCGAPRVVSAKDLPLYGSSPLSHTVYLGTDGSYHHFALQNGKTGEEVVVPVHDAVVEPAPAPFAPAGHGFVEEVGEHRIVLSRPGGHP